MKNITVKEYCEALRSFQKTDKSPGNDGITVEFFLGFGIYKTLIDALNYSHQHGELCSSQKQALITLLEKKEKIEDFLKIGDQFHWLMWM